MAFQDFQRTIVAHDRYYVVRSHQSQYNHVFVYIFCIFFSPPVNNEPFDDIDRVLSFVWTNVFNRNHLCMNFLDTFYDLNFHKRIFVNRIRKEPLDIGFGKKEVGLIVLRDLYDMSCEQCATDMISVCKLHK